ncbi:MAG: leucyl/phenylalanyl-tRNA--protein transferase [Verrucomicrobia bacterium]|nr:MAG: leucyl/phenylalanyl-tRNA--protein transferase [Verrucomicrobiota bacterium]
MPVWMAAKRPWGLLAVGGTLTENTLLEAYSQGIYSMYQKHPVQWFSCNPRMVLFPEKMRIEKDWRKLVRSGRYRVTFDTAFEEVVRRCGNRKWTWLIPERIDAAIALHKRGQAHSVEVWNREGILVGGGFGVDMGKVFIGESAFSTERNVVHVAFIHLMCHLQHWGYVLNDAQAYSEHLHLMGFEEIPRKEYVQKLQELAGTDIRYGKWVVDRRLAVGEWVPSKPGSQLNNSASGQGRS